MRISKIWDRKKNGISKKDAEYRPDVVYWWTCKRGHAFRSSVCADNSKRKIRKCGLCETPNELRVYNELLNIYQIDNIVYQPTFEGCKTERGCYQKFDFLIESEKVLVEVDGDQHFSDAYKGGCSIVSDTNKAVKAVKSGYKMIRIANCEVRKGGLQQKLTNFTDGANIIYYPSPKYARHKKFYESSMSDFADT